MEPRSEATGRRRNKVLRVKQSPETVAAATDLAQQLVSEGCSPTEQLARVTTMVADAELGEAIISCVESRKRSKRHRFNHERALGIYAAALSFVLVCLMWIGAKLLFKWVQSAPNEDLPAVAAACGQAILLRLGWHLIKFSAISLTDTLNNASYPTVLHRPIVSTPDEDAIRLERIRLLIAEMVVRLSQGEPTRALYRELSQIEFTRAAAAWIMVQARIGVFIKANFPPYTNRSRAYVVATGALIGSAIGIEMAQKHLVSVAQRDYMLALALLIVLEFLKSPSLAEVGETAG